MNPNWDGKQYCEQHFPFFSFMRPFPDKLTISEWIDPLSMSKYRTFRPANILFIYIWWSELNLKFKFLKSNFLSKFSIHKYKKKSECPHAVHFKRSHFSKSSDYLEIMIPVMLHLRSLSPRQIFRKGWREIYSVMKHLYKSSISRGCF